jgi:two-component system NtrC family sensor kinase
MLSMNVLVVDDDLVSRRVLENYLRTWQYHVTAADDGEQAWKLFQEREFPLVICDWMMPGMDGPELIRNIRRSSDPGYVYTILLTARSQREDFVVGMDSGADDFITKPFDRDELQVRLRAGERIINLESSLRDLQRQLGR